MTDLKKAARQALKALEASQKYVEASGNAKLLAGWGEQLDNAEWAITALRRALEQASQETPVQAYDRGFENGKRWQAKHGEQPAPVPEAHKQEPVETLGMYEHKCPNVTGHRGPSFVCQKSGHGVGQNNYCEKCECPQALEQPAQQEPVIDCPFCLHSFRLRDVYRPQARDGVAVCEYCENERPVIHAPAREWVGLTNEEIDNAFGVAFYKYMTDEEDDQEIATYRAIEAKLREKNT